MGRKIYDGNKKPTSDSCVVDASNPTAEIKFTPDFSLGQKVVYKHYATNPEVGYIVGYDVSMKYHTCGLSSRDQYSLYYVISPLSRTKNTELVYASKREIFYDMDSFEVWARKELEKMLADLNRKQAKFLRRDNKKQ